MRLTNLVRLQWLAQVRRKTAQMQEPPLAFGLIRSTNMEAKPVITNPAKSVIRAHQKNCAAQNSLEIALGRSPRERKPVPGGGPRERKRASPGVPVGTVFAHRDPPQGHFQRQCKVCFYSHALGHVQCALLNI
jgi:hypothetical protein